MDSLVPIILLLACSFQVLLAQMTLTPKMLAVVRGEEARFNCSTSAPWSTMVWQLNNNPVLTISRENGLNDHNPNVMAKNHSTLKCTNWEFILKRAERNHHGLVSCHLVNGKKKTATLSIQEKGTVAVSGGNRIALKGHLVHFSCEAAGWNPAPSLSWRVNDMEMGKGEHNISSAVFVDGLFTLTSNFSIQAVQSSEVKCLASVSALPKPLASSVNMIVAEVVQEANDRIFLLAVIGTLSAILFLVLLCICIVLCYRQRRQAKSSQQDVSYRSEQSESWISSVAAVTEGKVNLGYSFEGLTDAGRNDLIKEARSQTVSVSAHEIPDVLSSSNLSLHIQSQMQADFEEESSSTLRRVTTV